MKNPDRELFRGWKTPTASEEMRVRVLAAAESRADFEEASLLVNRLWESPVLRYGWAAAAAALVIFNVLVFMPAPQMTQIAESRRPDDFGNDPVVLAQLEKGAGQKRLKLSQHKELQYLLLAAGPADDDLTEEWRIDA